MKIEDLIKYKWVYHQIFGDLLDKLVLKNNINKLKDVIKSMQYKDVDLVFKDEIERSNFNKLTSIIFRFNTDNKKNDTTK